MKKTIALLLATLMVVAIFAGCAAPAEPDAPAEGDTPATEGDAPAAEGEGSVYFLNFKPEIAEDYVALAEAYTAETGVPVKVETAASGTYEQQLRSEIAKTEPPTIFQVNGPVGYASWSDYTLDLTNSEFYNMLTDANKEIAIKGDDGGVYGVPYVIEGYGIIYNDAIMQAYFAMDGAVVKSVEEINNFDTLKAVVEDMQAKKDDLGIEGVFASTSMAEGNQWRWQTHLANLPMYYEFMDTAPDQNPVVTGLAASEIAFSYGSNFKNIFDLYINNSTTEPGLLGAKSVDDAMAEFALGRAAMVQNGNWGAGQILGVDGNTVAGEDIKFMPIYTGVEGEESQGLCVGTENFLSINSQASPEDQQASLDFLVWMFSSETGKTFALEKLGIMPFNTFSEDEQPADPLAQEIVKWMNDSSKNNVAWSFQAFPSEEFKNYFGSALLLYVQGQSDWATVETEVKDQWASEYAIKAALAE